MGNPFSCVSTPPKSTPMMMRLFNPKIYEYQLVIYRKGSGRDHNVLHDLWMVSIQFNDDRKDIILQNMSIQPNYINKYLNISRESDNKQLSISKWNRNNIQKEKILDDLWIIWIDIEFSMDNIKKFGIHCYNENTVKLWQDLLE